MFIVLKNRTKLVFEWRLHALNLVLYRVLCLKLYPLDHELETTARIKNMTKLAIK